MTPVSKTLFFCQTGTKINIYIRALASARGSVARRAQRPRRKPLEGPKGPRVAKTRESEGPKGPRTSKAQCSQLWLSLPLGFHYFSAIIILSKIVAVIAKVDCRVFLSYQLFRRQNKQHCRANTTKFFLVLGKISLFFSCFFFANCLYFSL